MMLKACILLKTEPVKLERIVESVRKITGVKKVYTSYGRFDVVVFAEASDYKQMRAISSEINSLEGVRSTETLAEA